MDFIKILKTLKKWKGTFLIVSAIGIALIAAAPEPAPPLESTVFKSQAKILLTPPSGQNNAFGGRGGGGVDMSQSWFSDPTVLKELFKSEELLTRVQQNSGTKMPWDVLRGMIQVEPLSQNPYGVKLFQLSVTSQDPKESEKIARLITEEFSTYVQELSAREFASTRRFIEELVAEAEQRRLQAEENLMGMREKYLGVPTDSEVQSQQMRLETQRQAVSQDIPGLQAEVSALKAYLDGHTTNPPWSVMQRTDGSLSAMEASVSENRLKLAQAREVYTEENENVITAKARLAKSEELYKEGVQANVTSLYNAKSLELQQAVSREQGIGSQLNALLASQMSPDDRRATQKLERELSIWEENHLSLVQQLYQARVSEQSSRRQGSVNVLEQPMPGQLDMAFRNLPRSSGKLKKLATGIPFCLILGAAAALLREYLSTSMKLRPRIEEILEIPVIAVIPAAPSDLTVDWERFKRPLIAPLGELVAPRSSLPVKPNGKSTADSSKLESVLTAAREQRRNDPEN
jgi:capsular polysaccharide biosynthesis protein